MRALPSLHRSVHALLLLTLALVLSAIPFLFLVLKTLFGSDVDGDLHAACAQSRALP